MGFITFVALVGAVSAARAQPAGYVLRFNVPLEAPPTGPTAWSPLARPSASVPGCADTPAVESWRALESLRRWQVAHLAGVRLPPWSEEPEPARIEAADGSLLLELEETYERAPTAPIRYERLAPGCLPLAQTPPWLTAMPHVVAAFRCPRDYTLIALHTDGLVLVATLPKGPDGQPVCTGLRMMASLVPVRDGATWCREDCELFGGLFRASSAGTAVFEAGVEAIHGRVRRLHEVVEAGADRFTIDIGFYPVPDRPTPDAEPSSMLVLGRRWPARHDDDWVERRRSVWLLTYPPGHPGRAQELGIMVRGSESALQRGLRFAERILPAEVMTEMRIVHPDPVAEEAPPPASDERSFRWAAAALGVAALGGLLFVTWRRRARRG